MALCSFPMGVLAGVYLGEYARDSLFVRLVRIGVNNLAGIPSIVYGIFGMGFFINFVGWHIDHSLYAYRLSKGPVFGTGGVLWAALTLGFLTVPVVIVATEEAIRVIPRSVRESSYALGGTKFQTLVRVILPLASPGVLTGFILAMARAAGEVAPLMLTGVVNAAPTLPLDGKFPFLHLERQFDAPGVPDLLGRLPIAQCRGRPPHGLRNYLALDRDRPASQQRGDLPAEPHAKDTSNSNDMTRPTMDEPTQPATPEARKIEVASRPAADAPARPDAQRARSSQVDDLCLFYGRSQALKDITLDFPRNQVTALIGPSGCGKSTLLRCLNRMNDLIDDIRTTGSILVDGEQILDRSTDVIELRQKVGMVFQKPTPFAKTIYENVAYGLRIAGVRDRRTLDEAVEKSLQRAALWDEVKDRLHQSALGLSGGQHQRLVHRPGRGRAPRDHPHGRALLGPGPAFHHPRRGPHRRVAERVHDHHRHAQHATGRAGLGPHGISLRRRAHRIPPHPGPVHLPREEGDRGLFDGAVRLMLSWRF